MKFREYFQKACQEYGIESVRKSAKLTNLGKSSVERIMAVECDIPTDKLVEHVSVITGKPKDQIYEELDYLPIERSASINKKVMEIIYYRDTFLPNGQLVTDVVKEWLKNNYEFTERFDSQMRGRYKGHTLQSDMPVYFVKREEDIIAVDIFCHHTCGKMIPSSIRQLQQYLLKALILQDVKDYLIICTDDNEADYLNSVLRLLSSNLKVDIKILSVNEMGSMK